jgi:valyl-tRNA synthetase
LNYAHVTYNEYKEHLSNLSVHQMLTCATEYLYFICDYLIEFSKIDYSLLKVLNMSLKTCILMMYSFIPNISGELWLNLTNNDILLNEFEPNEFDVGEDVVNLIKFIKKIRSMSRLKIMIYENNAHIPIIQHMCHVKIANNFNCQMLGYKLYIENIFLLHDEIYVINDKLRILSIFFDKSQKDRVPHNIWAQKELDRDGLLKQKSELEELIKSNKNN